MPDFLDPLGCQTYPSQSLEKANCLGTISQKEHLLDYGAREDSTEKFEKIWDPWATFMNIPLTSNQLLSFFHMAVLSPSQSFSS